jgi:TP901 family phage tail tape measure protein|tara:strand:+ start:2174 stop:5302 length:3129 start_codon:yes stop_codon:yes gene_type:complete
MGFPIHQIFVRLGLDTKGLRPAIGGAVKQFSNMGNQLQMAGIRASFMFTAPILMAARSSFKAVAEFDRNMTRSTAIMGDLSRTMREDMVASAKEVASEIPKSAAEVAEGFFFLASAGLDAQQSMAAMPAVAQFAVAGAFDLAKATSLAADAQSALGLKVNDAAQNLENLVRVTDVLVKANTLANATTEQFSRALTTKAGAALKIVNKEIEEGVAVLAAFADQGIKAENAGTALNIVFRDLKTKGLKNRVEWQKFGGVFDKVTGKMRPIADIIGSLEKGLGGMTPKMVQAQLKMLGFSDKSLVFTQALIGMSDKIRQYEKDLKLAGGTTGDVADKQIQNIGDQMDIAKQKINTAAIALGTSLKPAFELLIGVMGIFENMIHGLAAALDLPMIGVLIQGLAMLLATIGPLLIALSMLAFAVKGVGVAFTFTWKAMGPIGIAIAVLVAAIALLAHAFKDVEKDADAATRSQEKMTDIMSDLKQAANESVAALENFLIAKKIGTTVRTEFKRLTAEMVDFKNHSILALAAMTDEEAWEKLESALTETQGIIEDIGDENTATAKSLKAESKETEIAIMGEMAAFEALSNALKRLEPQMKLVTLAEKGLSEEQRRSAAQSHTKLLTDLNQLRVDRQMETSKDRLKGKWKESKAALKDWEAQLRTATENLILMQKVHKEDSDQVKDWKAKIKTATDEVARLKKVLGIESKPLVDRESLTMMRDAKTEMTTLHGTVVALNAVGAFSPGSPMITGLELAKEKVKILEDSLGDLMGKAVEKAAELPGGLAEALALPEFAEQLAFITQNLIHFNDQIAAEEPFELAKEHWDDWKENAGDAILHVAEAWTGFLDDFTSGWGDAVGAAIVDGESFSDAMKEVWNSMLRNFIGAIAEMIAQWLLSQIFTVTTASAAHAVLKANAMELIYLNAFAGAAMIPGAGNIAGAAAVMQAIAGAATVSGFSGVGGGGGGFGPAFNPIGPRLETGAFAHGGIVTNPTLALIGEAGPEAVVPLSGRHGLGGSQHINLYMDGQLITETVLRNMPEEVRVNIGGAI